MTSYGFRELVFSLLINSPLPGMISGEIYNGQRPINSVLEDITILSPSGKNAQIQERIVNVNIYVNDEMLGTEWVEDGRRGKELAQAVWDVLDDKVTGRYWLTILDQATLKVLDVNQHCINFSLLIKYRK